MLETYDSWRLYHPMHDEVDPPTCEECNAPLETECDDALPCRDCETCTHCGGLIEGAELERERKVTEPGHRECADCIKGIADDMTPVTLAALCWSVSAMRRRGLRDDEYPLCDVLAAVRRAA